MMGLKVFCMLAIAFTMAVVPVALSQKYEELDWDTILNDKQSLETYVKCILEEGPCTPEGQNLKDSIKRNWETKCAACSAREKEVVRKGTRFMMKNNPEAWQKIVKLYDPENKFVGGFVEFVNRDD